MTFEELLTTIPLYHKIEIKDADSSFVGMLFSGHFQIDCYCPRCKKTTTLTTQEPGKAAEDYRPEARAAGIAFRLVGGSHNVLQGKHMRHFPLTMYCSRRPAHVAQFYFLLEEKTLIKTGQSPSLYDIASAEVRQYQKILGETRMQELQQAIRLAANGVGIGSFVYLRRIFESLIDEHRDEAVKAGADFSRWKDLRMGERINALKTSLPPFLVANTQIHGLLSVGVHTLPEEQCKAAFPVLKKSIMLILQQDYERVERMRIEKELTGDLGRLANQIGNEQNGEGA